MKQNPIPSLFVIAFVAFPILSSIKAKCQDLPEAQRLERCQNNKIRIAELEAQSRSVNADLSQSMTVKEMEQSRWDLVYVKKLRIRLLKVKQAQHAKTTSSDGSLRDILAYSQFNMGKCQERNTGLSQSSALLCLKELETLIGKKIDKAVTLNRPALLNKKTEIENRLAEHRNNLVALRCDEKNTTGICTMVGKWVHNTEGIGTTTWTITSDGTATEEGKGYATGKASFDGKTLSIEWKTNNGYSGTYAWTLNSNCSSEDGELVFKTPITSKHKSTVRKTN